VEFSAYDEVDEDEFEVYYHRPEPQSQSIAEPAINRLGVLRASPFISTGWRRKLFGPDIVARRRAERLERNKDDPFYIALRMTGLADLSSP